MNKTKTLYQKDDDKIEYCPFEDPIYAGKMQDIMSSNLRKGNNVVSMSNGDIIVTETKVIQTVYTWDRVNRKLIRALKKNSKKG